MSVRFGVALPRELVEELDGIAEKLNITRSKVIEIAIRSFLNYLKAINDPEKAKLVLIIAKRKDLPAILREVNDGDICLRLDGDKAIILIRTENGKQIINAISKVKCSIYPIALPG